MQIQAIHIENFGKLKDFDIEFQSGFNRLQGINGWGKTTLAAFIKAMLYGLDYTTKRSLKENERKKYMPWQGGAFGGNMVFSTGGKTYRAERFFGLKDKDDSFSLYSLDTGLESLDFSYRLGEELFHLDKNAFERSCFFVQQDFAASVNDSLNARLSRVEEDAGDMQNYEKAVASLEERMKFYQKTGGRGKLAELIKEQQQNSEELAKCRQKESAVSHWKEEAVNKEKQEQGFDERISKLEKEIQMVQKYETKAARKSQYDMLKKKSEEKENNLKDVQKKLDEKLQHKPLSEEAMDQCRESIFRLESLKEQELEVYKDMKQAESQGKVVQDAFEKVPESGNFLFIIGAFLCIFGISLFAFQKILPGILLFLAGTLLILLGLKNQKDRKNQRAQYEKEVWEAQKAFNKIQEDIKKLQQSKKKLQVDICDILSISKDADSRRIRQAWEQERKNSQEYIRLKQEYLLQREEVLRAYEEFQNFYENFTEEEQKEIVSLEKPEREQLEIRQEIEKCRLERERLQREQSGIWNQIQLLNAEAERIPELMEDAERIGIALKDGRKEYELLEKTVKYLKDARNQFSTRYLGELKEGFCRYLKIMEPEQKAEPSLDVKLKVKMMEAGAARDLEYLSAGWQDLVQIAERLAIVDVLFGQNERDEMPFLVLDDPFVNLDSGKQKRAIELLEKLSEKWQMIYFEKI